MMSSILLVIALVVFCYLSYRKTIWGLSIIILMLPSYLYRCQILGLPTTFLELIILLLFAIWLIKCRRYKCKRLKALPSVLQILLILWLMVSLAAMAINPTYTAVGLWRAYFLEPMLFFIVLFNSVNNKKDLYIIFNALAMLVTWLFIVAIYQNYTDWNYLAAYNLPNTKRLTAVFLYPNALSLLTAPLAAFFMGLWFISKDKISDWPYLLVASLGLLLAILARSDGAILAILVSLILALILNRKWRKWCLVIILLMIIITTLFSSLPTKINDIKQQLFSPVLDLQATSLEIRSSQWQETWGMLRNNSFWGAGLSGYQTALGPYHQVEWLEVYLYPHNIFLNFWAELGLLGLMVFLSLIIYILILLKKLFKDKNSLFWPITLLWLTWFVHGLVDVPYFKNDLSVLFFIMLALTLLADKKYW